MGDRDSEIPETGMREHRVEVALDAEESLEMVQQTADDWGAGWSRSGTGGRLELPVQAGLRHGLVSANLSTERGHNGTTIVVRVESSRYALKAGAVSILAVGGLGALALVLWPIYPRLLAAAPLALILSVVAWLFVASRLQNSGVEEFLDLVATGGEQPLQKAPTARRDN